MWPKRCSIGVWTGITGPEKAYSEHCEACRAHFFPPCFLHSSIARRSAPDFAVSVPHATILPSAAKAPHLLKNQNTGLHPALCLEQFSSATCSALLTSEQ